MLLDKNIVCAYCGRKYVTEHFGSAVCPSCRINVRV